MNGGAATLAHTQDEIVARMTSFEASTDYFGIRASTLFGFLDLKHARPLLRPGVTPAEWGPIPDPLGAAREYLDFAIGKAVDHRGLSALRSVSHFREWAWLSGDPDFTAALDADYSYYGAPILHAVAVALGQDELWAARLTPELERMSEGVPCSPDCSGCVD